MTASSTVDADGSYALVLAPLRQPGNWLHLDPDAHCLVVRSYFQLETSAQNDPDISVHIGIETLEVAAVRRRR